MVWVLYVLAALACAMVFHYLVDRGLLRSLLAAVLAMAVKALLDLAFISAGL